MIPAQIAPPDLESGTPDEASTWTNRRASHLARRAANARKTSGRRRFVDPATCDRDYTQAEVEFMQAIQTFKTSSGQMFPSWIEVLNIVQGLGYRKREATSPEASVV